MKKIMIISAVSVVSLLAVSCGSETSGSTEDSTGHKCFSGIYPHLAYYNSEKECGTGAVVPWQGDLWVITYSSHQPFGSDDKLYQISPDLEETIRPESIGGTPANRFIHKATDQLFIGPYVIDADKNVRAVPYDKIPGRLTGMAAHLTDPDGHVLLSTMEDGFYDVDMNTLDVVELYRDANQRGKSGFTEDLGEMIPGWHGKGFYSGQGVAVFSHNGDRAPLAWTQYDVTSGALMEWDGKEWTLIRRNQFTEITGPGGIYGNQNPATDPIWAVGWDYKSLILAVREPDKGWSYFRLPKASYTYDGAHGCFTEWPRIRDVGIEGAPDYLMTMHGMFWHFPESFSTDNSAGIRPRGAYLKVMADFARWNDRLVFGCDDSAQSEFRNTRPQKKGVQGAGQSNSNLWFGTPDTPDQVGPTNAGGSVWFKEDVKAGVPSDPFIFNGWDNRCAWIANRSTAPAEITFEVDKAGNGTWTEFRKLSVNAASSVFVPFEAADDAVWIRAVTNVDTRVDLSFVYGKKDMRTTEPDPIFAGIAPVTGDHDSEGLMYCLPDQRRALGVLARTADGEQYYEIDGEMNFVARTDGETSDFIRNTFAIPHDVVELDGNSVLIADANGRRWRLPLGDEAYAQKVADAKLRICREVATERDLLSLCGTFYELPAENADGFAKVRPVASHNFAINDYASYRGMILFTGIDHAKAKDNPHVVFSEDGKAAVWAGAIDDIWKMGKPVGHGGPLCETPVKADVPSDPFLIGFYDRRDMSLSHKSTGNVVFTVEVDPTGDGQWFKYADYEIAAGQTVEHRFPAAFQARWIRVTTNVDTKATALFEYR